MSQQQFNVMRDIENCRTAALGGHVDECDACGYQLISYNSCRNRHCPKCQALVKAKWMEARRTELLPVEYYHVVFTIPDKHLASIALQNPRVFYALFFRSVSHSLLTTAADPLFLGAKLGFIALLHTWGQKLMLHPHVHCLVPGGGLSLDESQWISCPPQFFLDVKQLSKCFKETMVQQLKKAFHDGVLEFHGILEHLAQPEAFEQLLNSCLEIDWVVNAKPPFGGPVTVLDYLGRYIHRIAISNHRLLSLENGQVTFTYKDYTHDGAPRTLTLEAEKFIRRFFFMFFRTGLRGYATTVSWLTAIERKKLGLCREFLGVTEVPVLEKKDWPELVLALTGKDPLECPKCHRGRLVQIQTLLPLSNLDPISTRSPP